MKICLILGMHRSGTSLLASWLVACGLKLEANSQSRDFNIKGNFENDAILKFHNEVLKRNGTTWAIPLNEKIFISKSDYQKAKSILDLQTEKQTEYWGWKEPRTCLFVNDLWNDLIPDAKAIVIFRDYEEVVNSLMRREYKQQKKFRRRNFISKFFYLYIQYPYFKKSLANKWLKVWIRYCSEILKFCSGKNKEDIVLFSMNYFLSNSEYVLKTIVEKFQLKGISNVPIDQIYEASLLNKPLDKLKFNKRLETAAIEVLEQLKNYQTISLNKGLMTSLFLSLLF